MLKKIVFQLVSVLSNFTMFWHVLEKNEIQPKSSIQFLLQPNVHTCKKLEENTLKLNVGFMFLHETMLPLFDQCKK